MRGRKLDLPEEVARGLAKAVGSDAAIEQYEHAIDFGPDPIQKVESQFIELLDRAPENPAVLDEIQQFYLRWGPAGVPGGASSRPGGESRPDRSGPAARRTGHAHRAPEPRQFSPRGPGGPAEPTGPLGEGGPARPQRGLEGRVLRAGLPRLLDSPRGRTQAGRRVRGPPPCRGMAPVGARQWARRRGHAAFHSLPTLLREPLAAGRTLQVQTEVEGLPLDATVESLQLRLAAGCLLAGDTATANDLWRVP
jgi:hypothetical protein